MWQITPNLFSTPEMEQLYAQPRGGWEPAYHLYWPRVVWMLWQAMLGLWMSPRRCQEGASLQKKLKAHGFKQDERDPCLFVSEELDIFIGVRAWLWDQVTQRSCC